MLNAASPPARPLEAGHLTGRTTTIAIGSAAKIASLHNIDPRCQTRLAAAARDLKIIEADLAVALSMSVTHKNIFFYNAVKRLSFTKKNKMTPVREGIEMHRVSFMEPCFLCLAYGISLRQQ